MASNWFIALPVTAGDWFSNLQAPAGVRLFASTDLHLTVAFLGPVSEASARAAFELAEPLPLAPLAVRLSTVVALGPARRPSAFSALLSSGRREVEEAMEAVRAKLWSAAGARPDPRPALAHVTLARPSRAASTEQREAAQRWALALELGEPLCLVDRVALYTWSEDRSRALFRIVDAWPLKGSLDRS